MPVRHTHRRAAARYGLTATPTGEGCPVTRVVTGLAMSAEEHGMLQHSAAILEQAYRSLTAAETTAGSETAPGRRGG
jgi:hypothetical protein